MLVGWVWLMSLVSLGRASTSTSTSNVTSAFSYNDLCTNQCDDSDNTHWCRQRREDSEGFISRCVEYTRYGWPCVSRCSNKGNTKYKWCMHNAYTAKDLTVWEYCAAEGLTIYGEKCVDACVMNDAEGLPDPPPNEIPRSTMTPSRYYYCHTSTSWDYCSPSARVKPLQLNIKGGQCKNECSHGEEDFTWCSKNFIKLGKYGDFSRWEYCSIDNMHTRYGMQCKDSCSKRGEDYYWCSTVDDRARLATVSEASRRIITQNDNWDYCSPKAEDGVTFSLKVEFDIYGNECINTCDTRGKDYFWCNSIEGSSLGDYCSKEGMTIYNSECTDSCSRRGESYFWCRTTSSWDYCSPSEYSAGTAGHGSVIILALGMCAWITA